MINSMGQLTKILIMILLLFMLSLVDEVQCQAHCDDAGFKDKCNHTCTFYDDHKMTDDFKDENYVNEDYCSHNQFIDTEDVPPIGNLERYKEKNVTLCCDGHYYLFNDNCKHRDTHDELACGKPETVPKSRKKKVEDGCPESCKAYGLREKSINKVLVEDRFNITSDGTMCVLDKVAKTCPRSREVKQYCLFYHCNTDSAK